METDKVRERIARQPEGCAPLTSRKKQRLAGSTPNFRAVDNEAESPQDLRRTVVRADTRAAADQQHVTVKGFQRVNGFINVFRNVALKDCRWPCL